MEFEADLKLLTSYTYGFETQTVCSIISAIGQIEICIFCGPINTFSTEYLHLILKKKKF